MQEDNIFDLLDSTSSIDNNEKTVLEKLEEKEKENPSTDSTDTQEENPWAGVPTVFDKTTVETAVEEKKQNDAKRIKQWLNMLLENEMAAFKEQHGYAMSGSIKRNTKRKIEKLYKKGKIKPQFDFAAFN